MFGEVWTMAACVAGPNRLPQLPTALAVIGRFGSAGCFSVVLLYSCELFPTVIRCACVCVCVCVRVCDCTCDFSFLLGNRENAVLLRF